MSDTKKESSVETPKPSGLGKFLWLRRNFAYCLSMAALVWVVGLCYYIENYIGWAGITTLKPAEFANFVFYLILPLLIVWFLLAYIERSSSLDANAELLQTYINSLLYPGEDATKNARAIATALQEQTKLLQKESKAVVSQSAQLKTDLDARVADLAEILKLLDTYSAKTLTELNDGIKNLADRCTYISDKTINSAANMREYTADIVQNSDKFLSKINPLLDEISAVSSNIKNSIADNKLNLNEIKNQLTACADISREQVEEMLAKTIDNTAKIGRSFYKSAEEYETLYKRLDASISGIEGRVDEQRRLINTQNKIIDHNSELLNNKLSKYGKSVSEEIDKLTKTSAELDKLTKKQISVLKAVNSEAGKAINGVGGAIDEKRTELERRCENAVNSMQNVIIAINKETDKLMAFTNLTQAKNFDLQNIAETIVDKVGDISNKLALKTDALKDKAVEVIGKFNEANEIISRSSDKINTSSTAIVNNSKQGVKLLEEQNFYINNALSNIDIVREKLDNLQSDIKKTSEEVIKGLELHNRQLQAIQNTANKQVAVEEMDFGQEQLLQTARSLHKMLTEMSIYTEDFFGYYNMADLWYQFIQGNQNAFSEAISSKLTRKQASHIRKAFDDNADFHNLAVRYLFLMDNLIKDIFSSKDVSSQADLVNFSVKYSLDQVYFVLIKALNNAD